jgi:YD repeat-containing protein
VGRETRYTYSTHDSATNADVPDAICASGSSIDLLKVEVKNGAVWDVVQTSSYNSAHLPLTLTDAALQISTATYLSDNTGRVHTMVTPPRNGHDGNALSLAERTTTFEYFADNDPTAPSRLKSITGPSIGGVTGPSTSLTYDAEGRVRTRTDADGYSLIMEYDSLDRLTKTTYPDGSYEETKYNRLDPEGDRDRLGRWSYTFYDALRRPRALRDALGRTMTMTWCSCGSLDGITDAAGNTTTWDRDLQGRIMKERRADGKLWEYAYEDRVSRPKTIKDPKQQLKTFSYDGDDKLTGVAYAGGVTSTTNLTFSYRNGQGSPDPYGRVLSMSDGTGLTTFEYHPAGTLGAINLKSVDNPGVSDVVEYAYDELGRLRNRKLNGSANEVTYLFDSLGRIRNESAAMGSFAFDYDGVTSRVLSISYPNGQRVDNAYFGNAGDRRLRQIHNTLSGGSTLSKFDYTYDVIGNISTWAQQRGSSAAETYNFKWSCRSSGGKAWSIGIRREHSTRSSEPQRAADLPIHPSDGA